MLARATATTPWGIEARAVEVEVDVRCGLPQMQLVGLPDTAVRESRERVRAAIKNCGFDLPARAVTINLAPADLRKEGAHLDLAIAVALLAAHGHLQQSALTDRLICGELGLDGTVRPVRGALAVADLGRSLQTREVLIPAANAPEAAVLNAVPVIPLQNLTETVDHLAGRRQVPHTKASLPQLEATPGGPDLAEVRGQEAAKRALEVAAAGGHNLLFLGPPGSGKTMLARRLPGLLPPLTLAEAVTATKIHSLAADPPPSGLVRLRPFRSPHTGISTAGMIGGGSVPRPGEASLAHGGVLFLDELPEFRRDTLEALRQPLEDGEVLVARSRARVRFPTRFTLVAAMNPCPCGHLGDARRECRCPPPLIERYRARVSGPLLDRIDLHVEVPAVELRDLRRFGGEGSDAVSRRVATARGIQQERFGAHKPAPVNATMGPDATRQYCRLDPSGQRLLDAAFRKLALSARALDRILKVARTVADLDGSAEIRAAHVAEAVQYRSLDRRLPWSG